MASSSEQAQADAAAASASARESFLSAQNALSNPENVKRLVVGLMAMPLICFLMLMLLRYAKRSGEKQDEAIMEQLASIDEQRQKIMKEREEAGSPPSFFETHGYSFDYIMVFPITFETGSEFTETLKSAHVDEGKREQHSAWLSLGEEQYTMHKYFSMKEIVERLERAGLETKLFYSSQRDEVSEWGVDSK